MDKREVMMQFLNDSLSQLQGKRLRATSLDEVPYGVEVVPIQGREGMIYEQPEYVKALYKRLSDPREKYSVPEHLRKDLEFHESYGVPSSVSFETRSYSESDPSKELFSYSTPASLNAMRRKGATDWKTDLTVKDLLFVANDYKQFVNSPQGRGLRYNTPIGGLQKPAVDPVTGKSSNRDPVTGKRISDKGERAAIYRRIGFVDDPASGDQYLDTRRRVTDAGASLLSTVDDAMKNATRLPTEQGRALPLPPEEALEELRTIPSGFQYSTIYGAMDLKDQVQNALSKALNAQRVKASTPSAPPASRQAPVSSGWDLSQFPDLAPPPGSVDASTTPTIGQLQAEAALRDAQLREAERQSDLLEFTPRSEGGALYSPVGNTLEVHDVGGRRYYTIGRDGVSFYAPNPLTGQMVRVPAPENYNRYEQVPF